ncbi:MAG: serine/threonine protein kinase, partial [Bdellovibrionales bacterium]|nr:serine/threonine protein kinase [Bdellovibrionales bacterium]
MSKSKPESCFAAGTIVDNRLKIVKRIAAGSMGTVYECEHLRLPGRKVALKVLRGELAKDTVSLQRFQNEIAVSYDVTHPNVVRAYDFIQDGDIVGYSMEFVDGPDLSSLIEGHNSIPILRAVEILAQICLGLKALHDAGIIHRDLKPSNILLTTKGAVRVSDFGIARIELNRRLTDDGAVLGSIDYLSPEYIKDGSLDARCDIYGLGMLAYRMISPKPPFVADSVMETLRLRASSDPKPPSCFRSECPPALDRIVLKAMAYQPERRYQRMDPILEDLAAVEAELVKAASNKPQLDLLEGIGLEHATDKTVIVHRRSSPESNEAALRKAQEMASLFAADSDEEIYEEDDYNPLVEPAPLALPPKHAEQLLPSTYRIVNSNPSKLNGSRLSLSASPATVGALIVMGTLGASIMLREPLVENQHFASTNFAVDKVIQTVALEVPSKHKEVKPFQSTFRRGGKKRQNSAARAQLKSAGVHKISYEAFPPVPNEEFKLAVEN